MNLYYLINIFKMFGEYKLISEYKLILNELVIPDISNIVIHYLKMFRYVEKFDDMFINECVKTGTYRYYNSDKLTLIHYMIKNSYWSRMVKIFKNRNSNAKAAHFQNRDKDNNTELYLMCYYGKYRMIKTLKELDAKYFQNKCKDNRTELSILCRYGKLDVIKKIYKLNAIHFQNKGQYGQTELALLIVNRHYDIVSTIEGLNASHYQNKDSFGSTELYKLCENGHTHIINNIKGLNALHFQNKNLSGRTELSVLCKNYHYTFIESLYNNHEEKFRLKACHFNNNNNNNYGYTELQLLDNNMNIIKFLVDNLKIDFVDFIVERCRLRIKGPLLLYVVKTLKIDKPYLTLHKHVLPILCEYHIEAVEYLLDNTDIKFEDFLYNDLHGHNSIYHICHDKNISVDIFRKIRGLTKKGVVDNIIGLFTHGARNKKKISDIMLYLIDKFNLTIKDFCDDKYNRLIHYFCKYNFLDVMKKLDGLTPNNFQNKNNYDDTELHILCEKNNWEMIRIIIEKFPDGNGFIPKHFQNKNSCCDTELHIICESNNWEMIRLIIEKFPDGNGFIPKHFQNKNSYGDTELYKLCYTNDLFGIKQQHKLNQINIGKILKCISENFPNETYWDIDQFIYKGIIKYLCNPTMESTLKLIEKYCGEEFYWYPKHFNTNTDILCYYKMSNFITYITNNFIKYNPNKNEPAWELEWIISTETESRRSVLEYLCMDNMGDIIRLITEQFPENVYWKPKHFANNIKEGSGLYHLINNKMVSTFKLITEHFPENVYWEPKHFINKNGRDVSNYSIYALCINRMEDIIKYITNKFDESENWEISINKWKNSKYGNYNNDRKYKLILHYLKQIGTI